MENVTWSEFVDRWVKIHWAGSIRSFAEEVVEKSDSWLFKKMKSNAPIEKKIVKVMSKNLMSHEGMDWNDLDSFSKILGNSDISNSIIQNHSAGATINKDVAHGSYEKDLEIANLKGKIEVLERQIKEKDELINKLISKN